MRFKVTVLDITEFSEFLNLGFFKYALLNKETYFFFIFKFLTRVEEET